MRRRPPKLIHLKREDRQELQRLLSDGRTEQRVARRCRVLLAMEDPNTIVDELTHEVRMTRTGVWYVCRRYERAGLDAVQDAPRTGRPHEISELE
ncbi:MAG: helix-turn-helix domain-containing protein, partial [Anaerolineae bacterium]